MNYKKILFAQAILLFFFTGPGLKAQDLTLKQALSEVDSGSLQIQKAKSIYQENSWKRVESYSGFLPTVNLTANYLTDHRYLLTDIDFGGTPTSVPAIIPTSNLALTAQFPIFDGFASTNRYLAAKSFESAAKTEMNWATFQVRRQMTVQFYKTLGAQALKDVAQESVKALEDHLHDIKAFKKAGVSTNFDVLKVDVQVSEANAELLNAIDNVEIAQNKLAEVMGKESETRKPVGNFPTLKAELVSHIDENSISQKGDLKALREKTKAFSDLESSASRYWVPRISLFGQYQYYNNRNDELSDWDNYREAYQFGVMLNWNLFDGMLSVAKSKESVEQRFQADKNLKMSEIKAKQDLQIWKRKFIYYSSLYQSKIQEVEKAKESVRLAKVGLKFGSRTNTDLLDAETELFKAKAAEVNAQINSVEALVQLELTTGQEIYKFN